MTYILIFAVWILGCLVAIRGPNHDTTIMWIAWAAWVIIAHIDKRTKTSQ